MRLIVLLYLFLFTANNAISQELKADISYKYMFANQWDKAVQTYNFSRPFNTEKQPLLIHGLNFSAAYIFNSQRKLQLGINLSYSYFRSNAENQNLTNTFNLHFINLGCILHYEKWRELYTDLLISATSSGLFRVINGEPFVYDETKSKAFGIGAEVCFKIGYYIKLKNKFFISPFASVAYTPYFYSPNTETLINQTKGLLGKDWTGILNTQVGIAFHSRN
jgi:hypothetical protein